MMASSQNSPGNLQPPTSKLGHRYGFNDFAEILPCLFLGSISCRRMDFLRSKEITLVVNVINETNCCWTDSLYGSPGITEIKVPVDDAPQSRLDEYFDIIGERIVMSCIVVFCILSSYLKPAKWLGADHFPEDHLWEMEEDKERRKGGKVLVHCIAGISRSSTIVIAYLMKFEKMELRAAHDHVKSKRIFIRPNFGFWKQLVNYEHQIFGKNSVQMIPHQIGEIPDIYQGEYKNLIN